MAHDPKLQRAAEIDRAIKEADEKKRADAEAQGQALDKLLTKLDSMMDHVGGLTQRMDALEAERADAEKRRARDDGDPVAESPTQDDNDEDDPTKAVQQPLMAKPTVADSRADAQRREHDLLEAQARADRACASWGLRAPAPLAGESLLGYRKRLLRNPHQRHSEQFAKIDLDSLADGPLFDAVESGIYSDSVKASARPDVAEGQLRMVTKTLPSGHRENTFFGSPSAWMVQCGMPPTRRYLTKIRTKFDND